MHRVLPSLFLSLLLGCASAPARPSAPSPQEAQVSQPTFEQVCATQPCRPAGRLTLWVDGREVSREAPPAPYTYRDAIYVFPGDDFAVTGDLEGDRLVNVRLVKEGEQPQHSLHVTFEQQRSADGEASMMLSLQSRLPRSLKYRAFMIPVDATGSDRDFVSTSSCPVRAGLAAFESWPHPIDTLVLGELRFIDEGPGSRFVCE